MKTYTKNYIGKGKKVANLDIITVSVKVEELLKNSFEYDGVRYAKFEIAGLKTPDNYGHTHTVYFSKAETTEETEQYPNNNFARRKREDAAAAAKPKKGGKSKAKKEKADEELPY